MDGDENRERDAGPVRTATVGAVRVLTLDAPPVNALGPALRQGLAEALAMAAADPAVVAVVIAAAGKGFSPGLDLSEIGTAAAADSLSALTLQVESLDKPVVAALHGAVLGGAAELALAAHARVAAPDLRLGWRDVLLGLAPTGGATQRLPRIVGAEEALRLLIGAGLLGAGEARARGLVDAVAGQDVVGAAVALAAELAGRPPRRTRDMTAGFADPRGYQAAIARARAAEVGARLPAPSEIIHCVEAAELVPFEQGLVMERTAAAELALTPEAAALRHALVAEMAAARPGPGLAGIAPRPVRRITLIGTGTGGVALALPALRAGIAVTMDESAAEMREAIGTQVRAWQDSAVAAGTLAPAARDAQAARFRLRAPDGGGDGADVVVIGPAAAVEPGEAAVVLRMGGIGRGHGVHGLAMPASGAGVAEIQAGEEALAQGTVTALALFRRLGLRTLLTGPIPGGIAYRLTAAAQVATGHLHRQGVAGDRIAAAAMRWLRLPPLASDVEAPSRAMTEDEISARILAALAAEGLRLLARRIVHRASDIDFVAVASNGFPRWEGGPMYMADRRGLLILRRDLALWTAEHPIWTPDPILDRLIAEGTGFGVRPEDRLA